MAQLTPSQLAWRNRIEAGLRLAAPFLDLLLLAGDRLSRLADRDDLEPGPTPAAAVGPGRASEGEGRA